MFCYRCGAQLSEHDFCTACGADVYLYKMVMFVSNRYYNDGLEKAGVRDLSGAVNSLRQSLKFNKNNVEARNLLGLVYFEMGEVVAAMSEWVISKNLRPERNIADDYIEMMQSNATRLDAINQTIKKYNQAYTYCVQDSKDLAVIQLKKVLSLNPKFVRAHQLLALLYMDSEQWERAQRELKRCIAIDRNNTLTLRYLHEVENMLLPDENVKQPIKRKKNDAVRYQSDNEVIIQPLNAKEGKTGGMATLLNIGIGLAIGLAACYFLVVPASVTNAKKEAAEESKKISDQLDAKTITIQELEAQIAKLQNANEKLGQELEGYVGEDGALNTIDYLLAAATCYLQTQDLQETAHNLEVVAANLNVEDTSADFQELYNTLLTTIGPDLAVDYYNEGYAAYRSEEYDLAIELLSKAVYYDAEHVDALYYLAGTYLKTEDRNNAINAYEKVLELFPDSQRASGAKKALEELGEEVN